MVGFECLEELDFGAVTRGDGDLVCVEVGEEIYGVDFEGFWGFGRGDFFGGFLDFDVGFRFGFALGLGVWNLRLSFWVVMLFF